MEVDSILLLTLRQIGCDLPEDTKTLNGLDSKHLVNVVATCLRIITGQEDIPVKFPEGTSGKFRAASAIASSLESIGCPYEVQFNQLMYPNDKESRNIISWLVSKLPRQEESEQNKASQSLLERMHARVSERKGAAFSPLPRESLVPSLRPVVPGSRPFSSRRLLTPASSPATRFENSLLLAVTAQVNPQERLPSLLEEHSRQVAREAEARRENQGLSVEAKRERTVRLLSSVFRKKSGKARSDANRKLEDLMDLFAGSSNMSSSRFQRETSFAQEEGDTTRQIAQDLAKANEEEEEARRAAELADVEREMGALERKIAAAEQEMRQYRAKAAKADENYRHLSEFTSELEEEHSVKRRVHDLLDDYEGNMARLRNESRENANSLQQLAEEWEDVRRPLVAQYRNLKTQSEREKEKLDKRVQEARIQRDKIRTLIDEIREKEERVELLREEYARLPKDVDRRWYTQRIMDIVKHVKKQQDEISKVLVETRTTQREMNKLADSLKRCFTQSEEVLYKRAEKDPDFRRAYKGLVQLREAFDVMLAKVEENSQVHNEVSGLEDTRRQMEERAEDFDATQILSDVEEIRRENQELKAARSR